MLFITKESDIDINNDLCCIYFYTAWIPYHKKMMIMIDKVEQKYKNIKFYAVDASTFINQCKRFAIDSVPSTIIIKDGREVKRINGMVLTSAFKSAFADICNSDTHINMEIDHGKER